MRQSRIRDPKEEVDRVLQIPKIYSGLVCQESKAYKEGTVRTKALLVAGRPREGSARLGGLGVGVKAMVLKWDRQGPAQTKTAARQTGREGRQKAQGKRRQAGTATGRGMRWARRRSSGHCCAGWTLEMIARADREHPFSPPGGRLGLGTCSQLGASVRGTR